MTLKQLGRLKTSVKGKDPALSINSEIAGEAQSEDAETAGEKRGIVRQ